MDNQWKPPIQRLTNGEFERFYVPRPLMPQVARHDYPALFDFAKQHQVDVLERKLLPCDVHPHQRIDHVKAEQLDMDKLTKPILISNDAFILDGNHRWWELNHLGMLVSAYSFGLPFDAAIKFLFSFPLTTTIAQPDGDLQCAAT